MIEIATDQYSMEFEIDALVLHGFERRHRYRIARAMERELGRLFAEQGAPSSLLGGRHEAKLDGGSFSVSASAAPETIGVSVARSIYQGLG
ncbi:MAG: hypothetical protein M3P51_10575 [Chloroflexota bacterium]|nr:hypothetical protein [Chloroflexota bacterium]